MTITLKEKKTAVLCKFLILLSIQTIWKNPIQWHKNTHYIDLKAFIFWSFTVTSHFAQWSDQESGAIQYGDPQYISVLLLEGCCFLPKHTLTIRSLLSPRGKNPITSLSLAIISPYYFQSLPIYHLSWDPQSSQKTGQAVMKQIIWSVMELKQKSLLNLSSGICVFTWMPGLLLISDSVFERETASSDYHYTMIHHLLLLSSAESLFSPSAVCFTDVMTSLALSSTSHTELWSLRWGTQTENVVWMSVLSWRWNSNKKGMFRLDLNQMSTTKLLVSCWPVNSYFESLVHMYLQGYYVSLITKNNFVNNICCCFSVSCSSRISCILG